MRPRVALDAAQVERCREFVRAIRRPGGRWIDYTGLDMEEARTLAAMGECAFAEFSGLEMNWGPVPVREDFRAVCLAEPPGEVLTIDVKTTATPGAGLNVEDWKRADDRRCDVYALVTRVGEAEFEITGWAWGWEVFERPPLPNKGGGGGVYYHVGAAFLRPWDPSDWRRP